MYGIYLIAALAVTGGAIAFIGDILGTKIGKKRLSIFGLRPRHTSNVITVITGILITTSTIGVMSVISENVRTALFGMEELNANLASKQYELDDVSAELILTKNEYQQANSDLEKFKVEVEDLKKEQIQLKEESDRLKEGNEKLSLTNAKLISDNEVLQSNNEKLSQDNESLIKNNTELSSSNEELKADNQNLEERNENLRNGLTAIREGDIVFRAGEVLASAVIKGNRPANEVVRDIDDLANAATANVSRHLGNSDDNSVWIYQPELSEAVRVISESTQDVVMRIVAAGNLMRGEPVRTSLELYKNSKVYDKDEFIISKAYEIQEGVDPDQVVRHFLSEVNHSAATKGVLPDPITGAVGVMEGSQFYQVVAAVSEAKGLIVLTAYAREETETIGPLRLVIKFEQMKSKKG